MTLADVIVVGAGIVGAACADALSSRGMRVTVIESSEIGGSATAAGMGHVVVLDDSEPEFALARDSQLRWARLLPELPSDVEARVCGTLWVALDDEEMAEARRKAAYFQTRGARAQLLDSAETRALEPALCADVAGGLLVPDDGVIYPPTAARWLLRRSRATVLRGQPARRIDGRSVTLRDGTRIDGHAVVNAGGIRARELSPSLPLRHKKGHLVITDRHPGFLRHQVVELGYVKSAHAGARESVAFNVQPRATGQVLIGSSRQLDVEDPVVEPHVVSRMLDRAVRYMPSIGRLSAIRTWTGFRAATPDGLPLIGRCDAEGGTWIAAGHEGLGITTSLGTAALLADLMTGTNPSIPPTPYAPDRFARARGMAHD